MKTWPNLTRAVEVELEIEDCVCGCVGSNFGGQWGCRGCGRSGPINDPDGARWNADVRTAREVESLFERNEKLLKQLEQSLADERLATANADRLTDELAAELQAHAETKAELETLTQKLNKQRNAHCETMAVRDQFRKQLAAARELLRQWESGERTGRLLGEIESLSAELAAERARPRPKVLVRGAWARVEHMGAELFWRHGGVDPDELMRAGFDVEEG